MPTRFIACIGLLLSAAAWAGADSIRWVDSDYRLRRLDLRSKEMEVLSEMRSFHHGEPMVLHEGKLYWNDNNAANLDGTNHQLIDFADIPYAVNIKLSGGDLDNSGTEYHHFTGSGNSNTVILHRQDPHGDLVPLITTGARFVGIDLAIDNVRGKIYWAGGWNDARAGLIQRANLDGSNVETLYSGGQLGLEDYSITLEIDAVQGMLYWTRNMSMIVRAPIDGGVPPEVIHTNGLMSGLTLEVVPEPAALMLLPLTALMLRRRPSK